MKHIFIFCFVLTAAGVSAQNYWVSVGTNVRMPAHKDWTNGLAFGGVNIGVSKIVPVEEKWNLRANVNFSRQVYWDDVVYLNNGPNPQNALGHAYPKISQVYVFIGGVMHYNLAKKFSVGAGLAAEGLLASTEKIKGDKIHNKEVKPIMPVVPFEIMWRENKVFFDLRFEAGLLNDFRSDAVDYGKNFFGVMAFEVGIKL
jgi:hypothetical protein